jgi:glycosyltransferase involved in cell wall biosynthesis
MINSDLVSIILPCFNSEKYISSTIKSVISQSYQNFELIIIDDASNDGSSEIIKNFLYDRRIIYFKNNTNLKLPGKVRNIGIQKASGNFLSFIDSDDLWNKNKIHSQISFMKKNNLTFSHTSYNEVKNDKIINHVNMPQKIDFDNLLKKNNIFINTVMINLEKLYKIKQFSEKIKIAEDFFFLLENLKFSNSFFQRVEPNEFYASKRIVQNSVSSNKIKGIISLYYGYKTILKFNKFSTLKFTFLQIFHTILKKIKRYLFK